MHILCNDRNYYRFYEKASNLTHQTTFKMAINDDLWITGKKQTEDVQSIMSHNHPALRKQSCI